MGFPIRDRFNGALLQFESGYWTSTAFISHQKGDDFVGNVWGAGIEHSKRDRSAGVVVLNQSAGRIGAESLSNLTLGCYSSYRIGDVRLDGESAFEISGAAAHWYEGNWHDDSAELTVGFFSYPRSFTSLYSGGYAYSDYEFHDLGLADFSFRSKQAGRIGVTLALENELGRSNKIDGAVVRWRNRLDGRECAAARLVWTGRNLAAAGSRARVIAIWENLDIGADLDNRRILGFTYELPLSAGVNLGTHHKIERRCRSYGRRYPFRSRAELELHFSESVAGILTYNYYDPDMRTEGNSYVYLSAGQQLTRWGVLQLLTTARVRYHFGEREFSDWERNG
jgi:hypothetical protein